ncbi:hypothetical protein SAMN04488038_10978 [Solimonas aquatica]|uniref:Uncharacterized protein n=1 Tax=Solimonas aquatica TaxID=489703 RepID=A0A1H9HXK5_9GAMM|nr:hypothetical protein [Solimonas aquatica]SEQ67099.1 hypothetical protein SAMN04488038_10978 [Solimonas aquatica]
MHTPSELMPLLTAAALAAVMTSMRPAAAQDTPQFGDSVRQMIRAQIYDPQAAAHPPQQPPLGIDGIRGEAVLSAYRQQPLAKSEPLSRAARIDVDPQH